MACCGQNKNKPIQPAAQSQPAAGTVINRRTRQYMSMHQQLIDATPSIGWRYRTVLKGIPLEIMGRSPVDAMSQTRDAFNRNSVPFDELNFWIEANIQWIQNTDQRHHLVSIADLVAIRNKLGPKPAQNLPVHHPPSEWGAIAWHFLGLVLAKDNYNAAEFTEVMRLVVDMLNPSSNPRLGCEECHTEASGMLNDLVHNPPADLSAARRWLVAKHNSVNARLSKPQLQMSEAASQNFWD